LQITDGDRLVSSAFSAFSPDKILTVSDWSDEYRMLSSVSSAEPGKWRTSRTPYLKEIMDCLSTTSPVQEVVFMKGSQLGGTEAGNNWIGYIMDHSPGPTMVVQPTENLGKRYSKQRVDVLIRDTKRLHHKVHEKKSRDSSNTATLKEFRGGILIITGANSATSLRSMPIRYLFLDEVDAYPIDLDGEGDPVKIAEARARTFARRKIFKVSTPTVENKSRISVAYEQSDQRKFFVPCPHCEFYQVLRWERMKWENNDHMTAHYLCEHCEKKIENHHKTQMLDKGRWIATTENKKIKTAGFHISALYSPVGWFSWSDCVKQFLESKDNPIRLKVFVNTILGETWRDKGDAPEWERLYERREHYRISTVPAGALFLTAGADVQKDRIEYEVVGWGADKQSWSVEYGVLLGDTTTEKTFEMLDAVMNKTFEHESGVQLPIRLLALDSGYNTQAVYNFVRTRVGKMIAVKGMESQQAIIGLPSKVDITYAGRKIERGARVWPVGSSNAKSELYGWLQLKKPTNDQDPYPACYCHFPEYPDEYFKMLTAEQLIRKTIRGYSKYQWEKMRDRNEALDCRIYARAAAAVVGLDRFRPDDWNELRNHVSSLLQTKKKTTAGPTKGGIKTKPSEFWE